MITNNDGVYIVSMRWKMYRFDSKDINIPEYINKNGIEKLLVPIFGVEKTNKIIELLNDNTRIMIDFKNKKAAKITVPEKDLENAMVASLFSKRFMVDSLNGYTDNYQPEAILNERNIEWKL